MKFSENIPLKFLEYQKKIKPALDAKGITQAHIYKSLGMSQTTWLRRLRNSSFTVHEILKICKIVNE
jgi:hypothetical protein